MHGRAVYHLVPRLLANQAVLQPLVIGYGLIIPLVRMGAARRLPVRSYYKSIFG